MNNFLMKAGLFFMTMFIGSAAASAQMTIRGTVTDKNGDPIPGVKVTVKKHNDSAVTSFDGTYSIETPATSRSGRQLIFGYGGYNTEKLKIRGNYSWIENADVKMKRTNAWNRVPGRKGNWFFGLEAAIAPSSSLPSIGVMLGWCKRVGIYGKIGAPLQNQPGYNYGKYDHFLYPPENWWATEKSQAAGNFIGGGILFRMGCALHMYAGFVQTEFREIYEIAGGQLVEYGSEPRMESAMDIGLMTKFRHFYIHGGAITNGTSVLINIGAGICF